MLKDLEIDSWEDISPMQNRLDFALNSDQQAAIEAILTWLNDDEGSDPYFLLSGSAGTGKTFAVKSLIPLIDGKIVFTAPTNKATKVLRETLTTKEYKPICRTIYSLLGLRMEANGAIKQLVAPEDPIDLDSIDLIVVDEASMVNAQLMGEIQKAVNNYGLPFLFLGDSNQLPPVNEKASKVWGLVEQKANLEQVMRFDNQILKLAESIKKQVNHPAPVISLKSDNDEIEGVWKLNHIQFRNSLIEAAKNGDFTRTGEISKVICWRNITVAELNMMIRRQLFDNADQEKWLVGDRIILTAPANDLKGLPVGCTDDEGTVDRIEIVNHPLYEEFLCYNLSVITDENKRISLLILHPNSEALFLFRKKEMAEEAKLTPRKWKDYWKFVDSFHNVQHGYAITAHRAQGSTYQNCYVIWNDILINRNRNEAFRCLYVACTRAKKKLILGEW